MIVLPEITEEEYKEYMALKRKEQIRHSEIDKTIKRGVVVSRKWRRDLNSLRGYAAVFANVIQQEYEKRSRPITFVLDRWRLVSEYLPPKALHKSGGKTDLNPYFRKYLREYGWKVRVDKRMGLFEVTKIL